MMKLSLVFNWIDWAIVLLLFWFLLKGFQKGLLITLGKCLRMGIVLFCCLAYFVIGAKIIEHFTLIPFVYAKIIAYVGLAFVSYFSVWLLGKIFSFLVNIEFHSWLDRLLGMCFGSVRYALVLGFLLFFIMLLPISMTHKQVYKDSFIGKRAVRFWVKQYQKVIDLVPFYASKPKLSDFSRETLASSIEE